eukprot:jgi/Botrbrau1/433/Bobra.110_2s0083.1
MRQRAPTTCMASPLCVGRVPFPMRCTGVTNLNEQSGRNFEISENSGESPTAACAALPGICMLAKPGIHMATAQACYSSQISLDLRWP